jgi:hypothetical protein
VVDGYAHQRRSDGSASSVPGASVILVTNGHGSVIASRRSRDAGVAHGVVEVTDSSGATATDATPRGR